MTHASPSEKSLRPSYLMTAYQFVFFTFYQMVDKASSAGLKPYRAALVMGALQGWFLVIVFEVVVRVAHVTYSPPFVVWAGVLGVLSVPTYLMVYENGPWKEYFERFIQLPRRRLIIGRLLIFALVVVLITTALILGATSSRSGL